MACRALEIQCWYVVWHLEIAVQVSIKHPETWRGQRATLVGAARRAVALGGPARESYSCGGESET